MSFPTVKSSARVAAKFFVIAATYCLAGYYGSRVDLVSDGARVFFPQAGIALAGLLLFGLRYWPAVFVGSVSLVIIGGGNWKLQLGLGVSNTLGAFLAAWFCRRIGRMHPGLQRVHDVSVLVLFGALLAPVVSATLAATAEVLSQHPQLRQNLLQGDPANWQTVREMWSRRWFGHGIAYLIVAPVFLAWFGSERWLYPASRFGNAIVLFSLQLVVCLVGFSHEGAPTLLSSAVLFAPFPLTMVAAMTFGLRGATLSVLMTSFITVFATSKGLGPFIFYDMGYRLILVQIYLTTLALTGLFLAAAMAERRSAERSLATSREELRSLSLRLQDAREDERARISREIHDELGQQLTGLKMTLHTFLKRLATDDPAVQERGMRLSGMIDDSVGTVRKIATELRPGILDDLGPLDSMHWLVEQFEARTGLPVTCQWPTTLPDVGAERSIALFRILQEALTNIARHANASTVVVTLHCDAESLRLTVEDDGVGLGDLSVTKARTLGLAGMRERATLLGGSISVAPANPNPAPGEQPGTRLMVVLARE